MSTLFQIPGNIKQQYLPFVLKPGSRLNQPATKSNELTGGIGAQYFSFRNRDQSRYASGMGRLQVCPSALTNPDFGSHFLNDISFKTLYGDLHKANRGKSPLTVEDILNQMPGVQIREFLPDTKLDQCINFFGDMLQSVKELWSDGDEAQKAQEKAIKSDKNKSDQQKSKEVKELQSKTSASRIQKFKAILWHAFDYMTGVSNPSLYTNFQGEGRFGGNQAGVYGKNGKVDTYLLTFPYTLYYRLQSCVTTNVYELPCKVDDDMMYQSNGTPGWVGGTNALGITNNTFLTKIPIIGDILKNVLGNVQINFMPWWDAEKGAVGNPEVSFKFDLFNDTAEAAMMNFIFVNTIVPNNRWLQYNMFQHSPNLYDVKLEGYNRLFACAGEFGVKGKGVLRTPPPGWVDTLCKTYGNSNLNKQTLAAAIKKDNLIKVPDVYEVTMKFTSLIPMNFNNGGFIFKYNDACASKITPQIKEAVSSALDQMKAKPNTIPYKSVDYEKI